MLINKLRAHARIMVDADKSITHRALILGAEASGATRIINTSLCADCYATINCLGQMGVKINLTDGRAEVSGKINSGTFNLDAQNSGTTARLLTGLLAGKAGVTARLSGDASLIKRPMSRIVDPLLKMGAEIEFYGSEKVNSGGLPIKIVGKKLCGIEYDLTVPSAQLKSAILLAGLNADGETTLYGKLDTRDHTEIMLRAMGANLYVESDRIRLSGGDIKGICIEPYGDFSSAIYFLVLALLSRGGEITVEGVNINPTRTAALDLLREIGARIYFSNERRDIEACADITACYSGGLSPLRISGQTAHKMIDELPLLAVMACFIEGESVIEGASELRLKESDRIAAVADGITKMGGKVQVTDDSLKIFGSGKLRGGCKVQSYGDHRIEMSLAIAAALCDEGCEVEGGNADISFPSFYKIIDSLKI